MKEIKLNLSEDKEKEMAEQITKIMKKQGRKRIVINILLLIFVVVVTMLFSKIGTKLDMEFIFGQLCVVVVWAVPYLYNHLLSKDTYKKIENLLFDDDELMQKITNEINKYEKEENNE